MRSRNFLKAAAQARTTFLKRAVRLAFPDLKLMATISQSLGMLSYEQARQSVIDEVTKKKGPRSTAPVHIWDAVGYALAQEIKAEREYPPFHRATRDGYAVRAPDAHTGATLRCAGEIKAGDDATAPLARWTCVQIMTGAG